MRAVTSFHYGYITAGVPDMMAKSEFQNSSCNHRNFTIDQRCDQFNTNRRSPGTLQPSQHASNMSQRSQTVREVRGWWSSWLSMLQLGVVRACAHVWARIRE